MTQKFRPNGAVLAASALALGLIAGCDSSRGAEPAPSQVSSTGTAGAIAGGSCSQQSPFVVALGAHRNSPTPRLSAAMTGSLNAAVLAGDQVSVIEVDGQPELVHSGSFTTDAKNTNAKKEDRATFTASVGTFVGAMRAKAAHVDDLAALRVAAGTALAECSRGGTVYLEDSGLQDTGALNFAATDLLSAEPADIAHYLAAHHELPELKNITVVLSCLGDTSSPQPELDQASRTKLASIWTAVLTTAHAAVRVDPAPCGGTGPADGPAVNIVRAPAVPVFPVNRPSNRTVLANSGDVGFLPDLATLRDPAAARSALTKLAAGVRATSGTSISLVGTTSSDGGLGTSAEAGRQALSLARAEAIRDLLVSLGVPVSRISCSGVGIHFSGYQNDRDDLGALLPVRAAHNRSVIVTVT